MRPNGAFFRSVDRRKNWTEGVETHSLDGSSVNEKNIASDINGTWINTSQATYVWSFKVDTWTPLAFHMKMEPSAEPAATWLLSELKAILEKSHPTL